MEKDTKFNKVTIPQDCSVVPQWGCEASCTGVQ